MADGQQSTTVGEALTSSKLNKTMRRVVIDGTDAYLSGLTNLEGQLYYNTDTTGEEGYDGTNRDLIAHRRLGVHLADSGGTQTIANNTLTALSFGTSTDPDGFETGGVITVPSGWGGLYVMTLQVSCGSAVGPGSYVVLSSSAPLDIADSMDVYATTKVLTAVKRVAAGESITPKMKQFSGGNIAVTSRLDFYRMGA